MSRTVYDVVYREEKTYPWRVAKRPSSRDSSKHRKKSAAVRKAKKLAKKRKPSQIVVHRQDNVIDYERTYGNDPRSSPG